MPRRSRAAQHEAQIAEKERQVAYLLGALEQIRRDLEEAKGGCVARALKTCETMLGKSGRPPRKPCV